MINNIYDEVSTIKGISLELYKIFREIGRTGNLTRAAENLYVTQPNVSVALKTLEEKLNTTLCTRTKKGIVLTKEGEVLLDEIEKAFMHIDMAEQKIDKLVHMDSGTISISASDTICNYYLLPYITAFTSRYPGIKLNITNRTTFETAELIKSGRVDYGFINLPFTDSAITITECSRLSDILIAGSKYRHLAKQKFSLEDIANYPLIMLEKKSNSRLWLDRFFESLNISLSPVLELGSLDLLISFVRSNLGIAFIPKELCGNFVDNKSIFEVSMKDSIPTRALGLAELSGSVLSHAAGSFKSLVLNKKNH